MMLLACKTLSNLGVSPLLVFIATYSVCSKIIGSNLVDMSISYIVG